MNIKDNSGSLGQRNHLSEIDIFQINELYDCQSKSFSVKNLSAKVSLNILRNLWAISSSVWHRTNWHFLSWKFRKDKCYKQYLRNVRYSIYVTRSKNIFLSFVQIHLFKYKDGGHGWSRWSSYGPCGTNCRKERARYCRDRKISGKVSCRNPSSKAMLRWGVDMQQSLCSREECYGNQSFFTTYINFF